MDYTIETKDASLSTENDSGRIRRLLKGGGIVGTRDDNCLATV